MPREYIKSVDNLDDMEDTLIATSLILKNLAKKIETLKDKERNCEYERAYKREIIQTSNKIWKFFT